MNTKKRMMRQEATLLEPQSGGSRLFGLTLLIWWIGGYGFVVYGALADRGPFAFLIDWQSAILGSSNMIAGALAGAVIVFWGPSLLTRLWLRLRPDSPSAAALKRRMDSAMMTRGEAASLAHERWGRLDDTTQQALLRRRRNAALVCAAIFLAGSWVTTHIIRVSAKVDAGRPLTRLSLQSMGLISLDGASRWVHVENTIPLTDATIERAYSIRSTAHRDRYTPLVPPGWSRDDRIFLVEEEDALSDDRTPHTTTNPPGSIEGEISTVGPRPDIARRFQSNGYAIGDWTTVLLRVNTLHGVIPAGDASLIFVVWWMGGAVVLLSLLVALIATIQCRRIRRRIA
jgi:hypothetical protein